ncbi:WD40 repeat domain-containing protein [Actinocorallia herbida]|uniref:WD40 repeat domain-containing protein n=1 Tax=Actinocorallia herbida TaxID=58109 RepID=UPI0011CE52A0|nr:WD40 repeat domain-containing protein [Actinocorallia herbida]
MSKDGGLLANSHQNGDIDIWDTRAQAKKITLRTGEQIDPRRNAVAFSPDLRTLVKVGQTGEGIPSMELWDLGTGTRRAAATGRKGSGSYGLPKIVFGPNGGVLTGPDQGVIDLDTGLHIIEPNQNLPEMGAISKDRLVAAQPGILDTKVKLWDGNDMSRPPTDVGFGVKLDTSIAFSPNGRVLAVTDRHGQIRLWDVQARRTLGPPLTSFYSRSTDWSPIQVVAMAFDSVGTRIMATDDEGRLRTYLIDPAELKAALCAEVGPLSPTDWKSYIPPAVPYRRTC